MARIMARDDVGHDGTGRVVAANVRTGRVVANLALRD